MYKFIIKRILFLIPTIIGVTFIIYAGMNITPGDPGRAILGTGVSQADIDAYNHALGYDLPFLQKFGLYIKRMVIDQDFGISYVTKQNAFHEIWPRFLVTLKLSFLGVFLSAIIGIPLGIQAAVKQYKLADTIPSLLAFLLAAMLKTLKDRSTAFRNILLLPYLMPSSAMLLIWTLMFDYGGVINRMVTALGMERVLWLEGDALRVPIVLLYIWKNVGFSVVLFASALSAVHPSLYEYAALEGAGWWTQSFRITLPQIMPTAFLVFVLAWVNAFKIFKEVYFIGGAYPSNAIYTLQHFMNNKFARLEYQDVTTAAYIFAVGVMVLFALMYLSKAVRSPNN